MEDCWITPTGKVIEFGQAMHNEYASDLLIKEMGFETFMEEVHGKFKYPYQVLHERGWVRVKSYMNHIEILGDCIDLTRPMRNTINPEMNDCQIRVAKQICEENNTTLHKAINDKRFW